MQYILLIYGDEKQRADLGESDLKKMHAEYGEFTASIKQSGSFMAGDALQLTNTAATVRVRDEKTLKTDGPFAATKEQLGGYYLVNAKNLDEATALAARIPGARQGAIEVRPIMVFDM
jgi:hypothetical protein